MKLDVKKSCKLAISLLITLVAVSNLTFAAERTVIEEGQTVTLENENFDSIQSSEDGGAIYNDGTLNITDSTFNNNSSITEETEGDNTYYYGSGGVIHSNGYLDISDSTFTSNTAGQYGGAIHGIRMNIVNSTFTNNKTLYDYLGSGGGAIEAGFVLDGTEYFNITSSIFKNNESAGYGGAVFSYIGMAVNNSVFENNTSTWGGGAIYNRYVLGLMSQFGMGTGTYPEDYKATVENSNFTGNSSISGGGGAIFNAIGDMEIINSNFTENSAQQGGAIYSNFGGNIIITADNGTSTFKENYTTLDGVTDDNAIYMQGGTLTLQTLNSGSIYMHDNIDGEDGYSVNITGDGTGSLNLYNDIRNANVTTGSIKINLQDNNTRNYTFTQLTSSEDTNWTFDIDASGESADTLTVGAGSSGTVTVTGVNFINGDSPSNEFTVQLLNAEDDNIQLAVDESVSGVNQVIGTTTITSQDEVTSTVKWNDEFHTYTQNGTNYGNINVATTNTTNDSLQLQITNTEWDEVVVSGSMGDTLALVNQLETEEDRNFNFDTSSDVYNVTSDLGTTSAGTMNVNGVSNGNESSTINGNNYNMFVLSNQTTLNLNNVKVTGANSVASGTNQSAVINMNNVELSNNASGITTAGSVNISGTSVFSNNGNGIEVTSEDSIITLNGIDGDGYDVVFNDKLKGVAGAQLNLKAGQVEFYKSVTDLDINMEGTTANLKADNVFNGQNLTVTSASNINMINNSVGTMQLNSLTLNDNMNLGVDVDLANSSMDRITADTYDLGENKINVNQMNLLSDAKETITNIEFADENLKNNVTTNISEIAYSPIYKYGVNYNSENGNFQFTRGYSGGGNTPSYNDLNPAVMVSPIAAQLGGYASMLDNYGNAFNHMDMYMLKPANLRAAELRANRYALADGNSGSYYSTETNTNGIWVRPYTGYDSVGLKHGPKVRNVSYGSFIGGDFGMHDFGNGLYGSFSPYISYQGAHQRYSGNSIYQNGGALGFTGTLYKGNFFTGLTAGVGANITEASTMFGNEDFPMLASGVASKTGYNIEFKEGKFIIQPSLTVSYTFVNAFDYTNGAGVRIETAPLHAVNINPNIRFSFNTKNYWQPYAFVGMNWNIMGNDGHYLANATTLPEFSIKPYVQYGFGIQKLFSDNFTAFAQIAIRNGGRNGVGGTLGMKWLFGGQPKPQPIQPQNVL